LYTVAVPLKRPRTMVQVTINYCLRSCTMGKYRTRAWSRGWYSTWLCLVLYISSFSTHPCAIFPI